MNQKTEVKTYDPLWETTDYADLTDFLERIFPPHKALEKLRIDWNSIRKIRVIRGESTLNSGSNLGFRLKAPISLAISLVLLVAAPATHAYYDDTVCDKQIAYQYLDQVQEDVGFAVFDATSESLALQLALTLGNLALIGDHLSGPPCGRQGDP